MSFFLNKNRRNRQFEPDEFTDAERIHYFHQYKMYQYANEDYQALGWRDLKSQQVRFKVLTEICDLNHCTVLDAGCGHADLRLYLDQNFNEITYYGIEQLPEFVAVAGQRYQGRTDVTILQGDFMTMPLPGVDYILVNGSLNYRNSDPEFIYKAIKRLFDSSRIGFGFNLLSRIAENEHLVAYPPENIRRYCSELTPFLKFRDDYEQDDYTLYLYHEQTHSSQ